MMEQVKIEIIYQIIINELPLNTQTLIEYGFTSAEIECLIDKNVLKQIDINKYELSTIKGLYNYGVKLCLLRNSKAAYQCFSKCFQLDSSNREVCLQLMLSGVRLGRAADALELFKHLEQISEEKDCYDNNLYLYIFNLLTKCPEEHSERLKSMDYDSYLFPPTSDVPFKDEQNYIRQSITKNKIKNALRLQNDLISKKRQYSVSDELLKEFIISLINLENKFKTQLLVFAKTKNYNAIISFLDTKSKKRYLTNGETFAYLICKAIINISETHVVPPSVVDNTRNIYMAIRGNNFALALKLEKALLKQYNQALNENIVYILLSQINELISELKQPNLEPQETSKTLTKTPQ